MIHFIATFYRGSRPVFREACRGMSQALAELQRVAVRESVPFSRDELTTLGLDGFVQLGPDCYTMIAECDCDRPERHDLQARSRPDDRTPT